MRQLLRLADTDGWETALYHLCMAEVKREGRIHENQRAADWKYLLPLRQNSIALVGGCGWGTVPIALSETCAKVFAVDSVWHHIAFLNIRKKQQNIQNLYPVYVRGSLDLPFFETKFDLVTLREFRWEAASSVPFREAVRSIHGLLKEGGTVHLSLGNRWSFQELLRSHRSDASLPPHTIFGYRRILQDIGFTDIQFYAPLPHHEGAPLFYIPLEDVQVLGFFFRDIFPLFETVSPEVRRSYAFQYGLAKLAVGAARLFGLTRLVQFLVPGFNIIAKKAM